MYFFDPTTSEQFHSELKTDKDVERLPSGKMSVNSLILQIAMIAFNSLRFLGQTALSQPQLLPVKPNVKRKRLRKVISDIICIAYKIVSHGRKWFIKIWEGNPWFLIFQKLNQLLTE